MKSLVYMIASLFATGLALAQNDAEDRQRVLERITSHPLSENGLAVDVQILDGNSLQQNASISLGETLSRLPGIHSAQFGSAVGRPVIHGLSGPRVRIMEDRIDTMDVSTTSGDHATTIEPFLAERIEVFKGPSVLLYGSGAIGGVVDVHTGRIPHEPSKKPLSGRFEGRYVDNSSGYAVAGQLNGGTGPFAFHVDAISRNSSDYNTPVFAESRRLLEQENETPGTERTLAGSRNEASQAAFGTSYHFDRGFVGFAISGITGLYGLPGGHAHEEENTQTAGYPTLDMQQARLDGEASFKPASSIISEFNARFAIVDYQHKENEPNGQVATRFNNDAWEGRIETIYETLGHSGAVGAQYSDRNFSAVGEEAFIQPVRTRETGAFWVGERNLGPVDVEAGARISQVNHAPQTGAERSFTPYAGSIGVVTHMNNDWKIGINADYSRRAPVAEELYSNGPHLVTASFERGNPDLTEESAVNLTATLSGQFANTILEASLYRASFTGFIYQENTGQTVETLAEVVYRQADATFTGIDAVARIELPEIGNLQTAVRGMFDWVSAERTGNTNTPLPRIPPWRAGVGLDAQIGGIRMALDYLRVAEVSNTAPNELPTDAYDDVSLWLEYRFEATRRSDAIAFLRARNLTDAEQRDHTSFIKDTAPRPGRTIEVGLRIGL